MSDMLDRLEALEKAATPGPWETNSFCTWEHPDDAGFNGWAQVRAVREDHAMPLGVIEPCEYDGQCGPILEDADADLIALSRNALPALLAVARAAEDFLDCPARSPARAVAAVRMRDALAPLTDPGEEHRD